MMDERGILGKGSSRYTKVVLEVGTWQVQTRKSRRSSPRKTWSTDRRTWEDHEGPGCCVRHLPALCSRGPAKEVLGKEPRL